MANYVLIYQGGSMAETPEAQEQAMQAWGTWFGALGAAVVDGGAPFGPSRTIADDGSVADGGAAAVTGYSVVAADDLGAATDLAKGCPILEAGGSVDVYETIPMG